VTFGPQTHAAELERRGDPSPPKRRGRRKDSVDVTAIAIAQTKGKGKAKVDETGCTSFRKTTVARSKESKQREKDFEKRQESHTVSYLGFCFAANTSL
jgi:hypothetical protein